MCVFVNSTDQQRKSNIFGKDSSPKQLKMKGRDQRSPHKIPLPHNLQLDLQTTLQGRNPSQVNLPVDHQLSLPLQENNRKALLQKYQRNLPDKNDLPENLQGNLHVNLLRKFKRILPENHRKGPRLKQLLYLQGNRSKILQEKNQENLQGDLQESKRKNHQELVQRNLQESKRKNHQELVQRNLQGTRHRTHQGIPNIHHEETQEGNLRKLHPSLLESNAPSASHQLVNSISRLRGLPIVTVALTTFCILEYVSYVEIELRSLGTILSNQERTSSIHPA